jgi:hypothetical protein
MARIAALDINGVSNEVDGFVIEALRARSGDVPEAGTKLRREIC